MTITHTEGPWHVSDEPVAEKSAEGGGWYVEDPYGRTAMVFGDRNDPEHLANAHLIAAAPDLLAALKAMIGPLNDYLARNEATEIHEALGLVDEAIAKAEGRTP